MLAETGWRAIRRVSSWPPTCARVRRQIPATASAHPWPSADTSASCRARCWIGSDLRVQMHTERAGAFAAEEAEPTARVRERVEAARVAAAQRWQPHGIHTNAEVSGALLRRKFRPVAAAMEPLRSALDRGLLSIRGVDRTLRVA